jgi:putative tryptophan/tyrosine transport system substrate-binding protein
MRRREFITLAGGAAAAWSFAARAQQPTMPVIGFLHLTSPKETREYLAAFRKGLGYTGFVEGSNVRIEYRWGDGKNDRLAALLAELVERQVSVLVVLESTLGALAAKAATQSIPIVFMQGADPVRIGLVRSLNHPEGNLTGINLFLAEVAGRRLQFLRESVPSANLIGYLRNPSNPVFAESEGMEVRAAARDLGVSLVFANAGNLVEIDQAFANFASERVDALFVSADGFLLTHSDHIVALATRSGIPAIYGWHLYRSNPEG